ncbi:GyrI-like domain-containing protein [soil metagenome]
MSFPTGATNRIELVQLRTQNTASVRETIRQDDLTDALGRMYQQVGAALARQGVAATGPRFARYHSFAETVDLEAGMHVSAPIRPDGQVQPSMLPAGPAARTVHIGSYETLQTSYAALAAWQERAGRTQNGGPWEVYLTDPSTEPDPARWRTEILWPLTMR